MPYRFTSTFESDYVHCSVNGENTAQNVIRFLNDSMNSCVQHACNFALLEDNLQGPSLNFTEIFEIISEASHKTWPHVKRIAFVDSNPAHSEEKMRFAETVARNRGVLAKFFTNHEEAIQWLKQK
jgi:hypothetical protein